MVLRDDDVLLSLWNSPTAHIWTLPGGGIEYGEQPDEACLREVYEETGYQVALQRLLLASTRAIPADQRLRGEGRALMMHRTLYTADVVSGNLRAEVGGSSIDAAWIPVTELGQHLVSDFVFQALREAGVEA